MVFKKETSRETIDGVVAQVTSGGGVVNHKYYESDTPVINGFAGAITQSVLGTHEAKYHQKKKREKKKEKTPLIIAIRSN